MTIKELYEERKTEFNDVRNRYIGQLDALHHLIQSGLGDTEVPDTTAGEEGVAALPQDTAAVPHDSTVAPTNTEATPTTA